jgi:hypothetical protein
VQVEESEEVRGSESEGLGIELHFILARKLNWIEMKDLLYLKWKAP